MCDVLSMNTIEERAQEFYNSFFDAAHIHLMDVAEGIRKPNRAALAAYGDHMKNYPEDTALEALQGYGMYKVTIYYITLAGGGPAARVRVEVEDSEVICASLQFQDWFTLWTDAPHQNSELVERYARLVGCYDS
jgi:hypothetical protein